MSNVLITGTNRGIGLSLARIYCARGDKVFAVCRQASDELKKLDLTIIDNIDITLDGAKIANALGETQIDILVNNAGILRIESLDCFNFTTMYEQFETNTMGPLKVTYALLENLAPEAKIVMITSQMGSIDDNGSGGYYGYRMSKAALNAASVSLSIDLKPRSIAIIHPGYVRTDMTGYSGYIDPKESAQGIVNRIDELNENNSGTFWHSNGQVLAW